jgi:NADPH-dependent 2,4-dienoyl-CoA reductase/sulfur reductase-like enzyme
LLATGANPRTLNISGADLENVFTLREMVDADRIIGVAKEGHSVVVIGASFIGMEAANALTTRGLKVTVVGLEAVPFENVLGHEIGLMYQREHEANGVQFRLSSEIDQFVGTDGHVSGVKLKSGEQLPASFVLMGVGVQPATNFLKAAGLKLNDRDQSVLVDKYLRSSDADIFAAGDIARWDNSSESGQRIEHWRTAQQHGIVAARNMLGQQEDVNRRVPFFWTVQWGHSLRYVGHATKWDEIIFRGSPDQKSFIAFYVAGGKLLAAAGLGRDREMDALELILRDNINLSTTEMRDEKVDLVAKSGGA